MLVRLASAADLSPGAWKWPHVDPAHEWADHVSGALAYEADFLDRFERLRVAFGHALPINSGYRTPAHNEAISTTGDNGPHTTGRACDVQVYGTPAFDLIRLALLLGFTGIGVQQKGDPGSRYLHLDDLTAADGFPRPMVWSY